MTIETPSTSKEVVDTEKKTPSVRKRTVSTSSNEEDVANVSFPVNRTPVVKRQRLSQGQEMVQVVKDIFEKQEQTETKRQELAKAMHDEKMDKLQQFIDTLKNMK